MEAPRAELGEFAPKIETIKIPVDKIREVIGSGGKVIREITAETGAKVDIGDDGTIKIAAAEQAKIDAASDWIKSIASKPEVGAIYTGKVVKIVDFGAFVNFFGAKDGLVHVQPDLQATRVEQGLGRAGRKARPVEGEAPGLRRPRQDPPVDEGRRPGDRRGPFQEGRRPAGRRGQLSRRPFCGDFGSGPATARLRRFRNPWRDRPFGPVKVLVRN